MGQDRRAEELEKQIEALKSGKFKWIKPGGFIDMTKSRIKELTTQLDKLKSRRAGKSISPDDASRLE